MRIKSTIYIFSLVEILLRFFLFERKSKNYEHLNIYWIVITISDLFFV